MKNALVTAIGSFSADVVIKNLKKMGYRVIGCDIYPREWVADAYNVNEFYQAPRATDREAYLEFLRDVCSREAVSMLLPLTDVEVDVLNHNRSWFELHGVTICISPSQTLDICRDKVKTEQFIRSHGNAVRTIPSYTGEEAAARHWEFPMVCKPFNGRSSEGLHYLHTQQEWETFRSREDLSRYVVQPYIQGDIITVDVVRDSLGTCVAIPRRELLRTPNGAGTSVYVFGDPDLENASKALADQLGVIGCVNFEFIADDRGEYHFIECNPRFAGGVEFSCIAGYDCVRNHIRAYCGEPAEPFTLDHNQFIARKYEEYVTKVE